MIFGKSSVGRTTCGALVPHPCPLLPQCPLLWVGPGYNRGLKVTFFESWRIHSDLHVSTRLLSELASWFMGSG